MYTEEATTALAATIAPEDLRRGDFVAVLSVVREYPSFMWCSDSALYPREEPVRIRYSSADGGLPWKVKDICLPFVFVKDAAGKHKTLDTRLCRLVRLPRSYARRIWKVLRESARDENKDPSGPCRDGLAF